MKGTAMYPTSTTERLERLARETWIGAIVRRSDVDSAGRYLLRRPHMDGWTGLGWTFAEAARRLDELAAESE
jgi:hypothetical protein